MGIAQAREALLCRLHGSGKTAATTFWVPTQVVSEMPASPGSARSSMASQVSVGTGTCSRITPERNRSARPMNTRMSWLEKEEVSAARVNVVGVCIWRS